MLALGDVEVRPELEGDADHQAAVPGRLGAHEQHAIDAVDLLLEHRRDRVGNRLGAGSRVGCGDLDRRRHDVRILRHRQRAVGDRARERDDDGDDRGEDRPLDEKVRQAHRLRRRPDRRS